MITMKTVDEAITDALLRYKVTGETKTTVTLSLLKTGRKKPLANDLKVIELLAAQRRILMIPVPIGVELHIDLETALLYPSQVHRYRKFKTVALCRGK